MMKHINCVIFDMDGVIIDSESLHKKAYFDTFKMLNITVTEELYGSLTGASTINTFQKLVDHFKLKEKPEDLVNYKRERFVGYFETDPDVHLIEGVEELIQFFYNQGKTLVLASSAAMINIIRIFDRFNLHNYFKDKISGADLKESKPNPEIFERAAELGGFPRNECIVIEDSDNGVKAANDAGIFVVGYKNPLVKNQTLKNADLVVNNYKELKALF